MSAQRRLVLFASVAALAGCTLLTQFNPEGQPCDLNESDPALQCLSDAGFWCAGGVCKKGDGPGMPDAGGVDAGEVDGGSIADGGGTGDAGATGDAGRLDGGSDGGMKKDGGLSDAGTDGGVNDAG